MLAIAIILSLVTYSIVVSQPLAYLVFLGEAQAALSAAAYIELRQRIDAVMNRRLAPIYGSTLVALLLQLALSWRRGNTAVLTAASVALSCLIIDVVMAMRRNVPINEVIDRWSITDYPADWETYRSKWFAAFRDREMVQLIGFVSLILGAVYGAR